MGEKKRTEPGQKKASFIQEVRTSALWLFDASLHTKLKLFLSPP